MVLRAVGLLAITFWGFAQTPSLPLMFEPNLGQLSSTAPFFARGAGYFVECGVNSLSVASASGAIQMTVRGASRVPRIHGEGLIAGKASYFIGDSNRWQSGLPLYQMLVYRDLYPGIDMALSGRGGQLEYDFRVRPGADVAQIQLSFDGIKSLAISSQGDLVLTVTSGVLRHRRPHIYQELNGKRIEVGGSFVLRGAREAGFEVASYNRSQPLVIDPTLVYATYLGGNGTDSAWAVAVDSTGCAYVVGETWPIAFPTSTALSHSTGSQDAFVIKLDPTGTTVVYATYFGGQARESARSVAVDTSGNAYIAGFSDSSDFPTTNGAYQRKPNGTGSAFIVKLNASGTGLEYATLIGGAGNNWATGIAVDPDGDAYVSGYTSSLSFPVTPGALQPAFGGGVEDAFVIKLNPYGSGLLYSTYLGGAGIDIANGIAVDPLGYAYVVGYTDSSDFPVRNAMQPNAGGQGDGFIAKVSPGGNYAVFATYLGGRLAENAVAVAVDVNGSPYIAGSTSSTDFPVMPGAYQSSKHAGYDAFVSKLAPSGTTLVYSTYLGGEGSEEAEGIVIDGLGRAYIAGFTNSLQFPEASECSSCGGLDTFIAALDVGGSVLWTKYFGGAGDDRASGIAIDGAGNVYVAGYTYSPDFGVTRGAYRETYSGGDAFIVKFSRPNTPPQAVSVSPSSGSGLSQTFTFVFSDANGAADLSRQFILFNQGIAGEHSCLPHFDGKNLYLLSDDAKVWMGPVTPGGPASVQNSQCTLSGLGSAAALSGTELTLRLALTFAPTFAGPKTAYMQTTDRAGLDTGLQPRGNWTVGAENTPPQAVSVSPSSGSGLSQTFTFVFSDANGAADLSRQFILFNQGIAGEHSCLPHFDGKNLYLLSDDAKVWMGPVTPGGPASVQNSQCTLSGLGSAAALSGTELTLRLALTFAPTFAGPKTAYMQTTDRAGLDTGLQPRGNWTVGAENTPPQAVSVSPSSGSGLSQTFTFVFSDANGAADLSRQFILFNQGIAGEHSCLPHFDGKNLYLLSDDAKVWMGPVTPGGPASVQNSQCTLSGLGSAAALSGTELTLRLALTFAPTFAGPKTAYMQTTDRAGLDTGLQPRGNWTVGAENTPPQAVSVSPSSGSGLSQTFTFVFSDANGAADLSRQFILFNQGIAGEHSCLPHFDGKNLYLLSDDAKVWMGPVTPGGPASVQNSQCTLSGLGSAAALSGTELTLRLALTFAPTFAGPKTAYMQTTDRAGLDTGLQPRGNWTVPH